MPVKSRKRAKKLAIMPAKHGGSWSVRTISHTGFTRIGNMKGSAGIEVMLAASSASEGIVNAPVSGSKPTLTVGSDRASAIEVRKQWMRAMGLGESDIAEHCADDVDISLEKELANLKAIDEIRILASS